MPNHSRKKYHSPESLFIMPDQMAFFVSETPATPDPVLEAQRRKACAELKLIADYHRAEFKRVNDALKSVRGDAPEAAENGESPAKDRRIRPWRLRPGTNMDVVATMLEAAGRKGVSEAEMVEHLRSMGRLTTASEPQRSVHWTVTELRKRTLNAVRKGDTKGARWYAYGNFNEWRGPQA